MHRIALLLLLAGAGGLAGAATGGKKGTGMQLTLDLRTRVELFRGTGEWQEVVIRQQWAGPETALLLCDMWDRHWCAGASRRCHELAGRIAPVLAAARARGVFVIHAPSDCMEFYREAPQRRRMQEEPAAPARLAPAASEPPLPIDDSDGGCDDQPQCRQYRAWSRQHPAIPIAPEDGISDSGDEVHAALRRRGIRNLLVAGVHTNMCVLGRSFAIRAMLRRGLRVALVRDLTDTMYNPRKAPFVPHERCTELVVEHIEKYLAPTITSHDVLAGAR